MLSSNSIFLSRYFYTPVATSKIIEFLKKSSKKDIGKINIYMQNYYFLLSIQTNEFIKYEVHIKPDVNNAKL